MTNAFLYGPRAAIVLCAALLALAGCQGERASESARQAAPSSAPAAPSPAVHVLVDEAMLRKPHAVLGGTVQNVGGERLENLSVELELKRRADGATEIRSVPVAPAALGPGEKGRYSLKVLSGEWSSSRLLRLRAGGREELAFKTSPGARRPPERIPDSRTIPVTKDSRPRPRSGGEEFINTPDTPVSVP
ncbi:MAG TPA: hypothetical protein VN228_18305 [Pyrinomonadaceae bacterium]|nr:hypothetical protein [Pyrinomonadaceae bacterium]